MGVVYIAEKPEKSPKGLKSDLTLSLPVTDFSNNNYITEISSTTTSDRVLLLIDAIFRDLTLSPEGTDLFYEKRAIRIFQFFINKYHSKVMYSLNMLKFSSYWELSVKLNMNMDMLRRSIADLENFNIVKELKEEDHKYRSITEYWHNRYPTSPKLPTLFMLNPQYSKIVELYKHIIFKKYITVTEYNYLNHRNNDFKTYYEGLKNKINGLRTKEEEAIGKCKACGKLIIKKSVRGKDYYKFSIGLICNLCKRSANKEVTQQWMSQKNK